MKFRDYGVTQVLIGLHRVGLVGLREAIRAAVESTHVDRDALIAVMMDVIAGRNYIPAHLLADYRTAVWREYLRHRGEDFGAYLSEIPVVIRGDAGEERNRFVATVRAALARSELRPAITFEPAEGAAMVPRLLIGDQVVANGSESRRTVENAVRHAVSDW